MTLAKTDLLFGTVPPLDPVVSDLAGVLNPAAKRSITETCKDFSRTFPQVRLSVLFPNVASDIHLGLYSFWIFNRAVCRSIDKGSANHDILLTVDTVNGRSNLIVGYGLEPFVNEQHLTSCLDLARAQLVARDFPAAARAVATALTENLATISSRIGETYGIDLAQVHREDNRQPDA